MYSSSSSFLGGNSGRPGPQQYGSSFNNPTQSQSPFQSQPPNPGFQQPQQTGFMGAYGQSQQMQPQATGFPQQQMQQPTGFGQQQMQPQPTGFQQQQPQPQPTGYGGGGYGQQQMQTQPTGYQQPQQQQSFQTGIPPVPPLPPMPQQQSQPAPMKPQATGFAQMAASFQTTPQAEKPKGRRAAKPGVKIPNIRLSFITAADQAKFETLFRSAVGDGQTLSGDKSRDLLLRSKLDGNALSQIW